MISRKNTGTPKAGAITPVNLLAAVIVIAAVFGVARLFPPAVSADFSGLESSLFPEKGFNTGITLGNVVPKLVENGVIDMDKLTQVYAARGNLSADDMKFFTEPSNNELILTNENAGIILNAMWAFGIANKNPVLDQTANYNGVANLASTGGWTLGKDGAMSYFNKIELVKLTPAQQIIFEEVAENAYRPCCDNPTAFPDCNHGAALLALLELGASQGMNENELYTLALQANTMWFPQQYLMTALYFQTQSKDYWSSAKEIMSAKYSSSSGWAQNVYKPLQAQNLVPKTSGGGSCGV